MDQNKIRVGITHGDYNGIGYEIILKSFDDGHLLELCTPVVYGSAKIAQHYRKLLGLQGTSPQLIEDAADARDGSLNVIDVVGEDTHIEPGTSSERGGEAAFKALEAATTDLKDGKIDVLVTAPINKKNVQSEQFSFPGHTEYLQAILGTEGRENALMIMSSQTMRVAMVTAHLPLAQVPEQITRESVIQKIDLFNRALIEDYGIVKPRIAVLALNPHAGEEGLLGAEEQTAIIPAIEEARQNKMLVFGPYAADGFFGSGAYKKFDGILAMYHDQGLAPFKTLGMDTGVNYTAGLPYVRTSPDHGTGYDIAGKGEASPESMRQAIYCAIDVARNRARAAERTANPLPVSIPHKNKKDKD